MYAADGLNVLLSGKHGVGKTAIIKEIFNEQFGPIDVSWKYFSASTLDPWVDFIGIPKDYQNADGDTVFRIVPPESFTGKEKIEAIFLDEINRADEKTLNAIMELIQFKSINGRKFPHLKCVWAAENPADDDDNDYSVRQLDPAQRDRFQIQLKVPYVLDKDYMVGKYGNVLFDISKEWWEGAKGERKKIISPRKLDDMLAGFARGYDISDFTTNISVTEFKQNLESVGKFEQYRIIANSGDITNIKNFYTIDKIRQAENLFPTLDPKNNIFNNVYPLVADEVKKYITRTFNYDYNDRNKVVLSDAQLKFITSMGGIPTKPQYKYENAKEIRDSISELVSHFSYKDLLTSPILDASDLKIIIPFEFDEDIVKESVGNVDLAKALTSDKNDFENFKKFYKFVMAGCILIGKTKGIDYLKETTYFKIISGMCSLDTKANRVYSISVVSNRNDVKNLTESNFTIFTEENFKDENLFYSQPAK